MISIPKTCYLSALLVVKLAWWSYSPSFSIRSPMFLWNCFSIHPLSFLSLSSLFSFLPSPFFASYLTAVVFLHLFSRVPPYLLFISFPPFSSRGDCEQRSQKPSLFLFFFFFFFWFSYFLFLLFSPISLLNFHSFIIFASKFFSLFSHEILTFSPTIYHFSFFLSQRISFHYLYHHSFLFHTELFLSSFWCDWLFLFSISLFFPPFFRCNCLFFSFPPFFSLLPFSAVIVVLPFPVFFFSFLPFSAIIVFFFLSSISPFFRFFAKNFQGPLSSREIKHKSRRQFRNNRHSLAQGKTTAFGTWIGDAHCAWNRAARANIALIVAALARCREQNRRLWLQYLALKKRIWNCAWDMAARLPEQSYSSWLLNLQRWTCFIFFYTRNENV